MTKNTWALVAAVALGLASLSAISAAPKNGPILVKTHVADSIDGYPLRVQGDGILVQQDGSLYETTTIRKVQTIYSAIDRFLTGTGWSLTLYAYDRNWTPSGRTVFFDLSEPAVAQPQFPDYPNSNLPQPPEAGYYPAHMIAKCNVVNVDMLTLTIGGSVQCPGSFRFQATDGAWYRLAFNPSNYPQVNPLQVTCLTTANNACSSWSLTPSGGASTTDPLPKNVTKLLRINTNEEVLADLGDYYVSFNITVKR